MKDTKATNHPRWLRWLPAWNNPGDRDIALILGFFILVILLGLFSVWIYHPGPQSVTPLLWAQACLGLGAFFGFLFGIPKILQSTPAAGRRNQLSEDCAPNKPDGETEAYRQQVNTNLTEISDWITKILVGLGLIHLKEIPPLLKASALLLTNSMHPSGPDQDHFAFALAIIVGFSVMGFMFGYLATRLFLAGAFARADQGPNSKPVKLTTVHHIGQIVDAASPGETDPRLQEEVANLVATAELAPSAKGEASEYYLRHSAQRDPSLDNGKLIYYRLKFWIDADNPAMLDGIEKVVYVLHPSFKNQIREVKDRTTSFAMSTFAWGEFNLKAIVQFKNGKSLTLERYVDFQTASIDD